MEHAEREAIAAGLDILLKTLGVMAGATSQDGDPRLPIVVRSPADNLQISTYDEDVKDWHRDGVTPPTSDALPQLHWMIVWSNKTPTRIRERASLIELHFDPFDVILVNNHRYDHRCPPPEEGRWFARLLEPVFSHV